MCGISASIAAKWWKGEVMSSIRSLATVDRLYDDRYRLVHALTSATELLERFAKTVMPEWDGSATDFSVIGRCRALLKEIEE